jgi:hypothetical protein
MRGSAATQATHEAGRSSSSGHTPAVKEALRLLEAQAQLATDLDDALGRCSEARVRFEAGARDLEALVRELAAETGFDAARFEYQGGLRLQQWIRARGVDQGFAPAEMRCLDAIKGRLTKVPEVASAAQ